MRFSKRRRLGCLVLFLTTSSSSVIAAEPRSRESSSPSAVRGEKLKESFIKRAVFAEDRLWLLTDTGGLSSLVQGTDARTEEHLPEKGLDLCLLDAAPAVVSCKERSCETWVVRVHAEGRWSAVASVPSRGDRLVAMRCVSGEVTLISSRRIVDVHGDKTESVALDQTVGGPIASVQVENDSVYLGIAAGEFGGGLRRLDRRTGKVTVIERNATGQLCGGPLNTKCDPVNGLASEPWRPGCVAAAIGLVHMTSRGRLVEICGDDVKRIYFRPYPENLRPTYLGNDDEPLDTLPFFGLVRQGADLWAVGMDALYRVREGNVVETRSLPKFETIGGVGVSFELSHLVLVVTMINRRFSLSGGTPLLVPR